MLFKVDYKTSLEQNKNQLLQTVIINFKIDKNKLIFFIIIVFTTTKFLITTTN